MNVPARVRTSRQKEKSFLILRLFFFFNAALNQKTWPRSKVDFRISNNSIKKNPFQVCPAALILVDCSPPRLAITGLQAAGEETGWPDSLSTLIKTINPH